MILAGSSLDNIKIGDHIIGHVFGISFNADTVWSTAFAGLVTIALGLYMARRAKSGVPSKLQLVFEAVVDGVENQVEQTVGHVAPFVVPLAVCLFFFILVANWMSVIPSGLQPEHLPPPTADVNLTAALALLVIVWAIVTGIRQKGLWGWLKGFTQPVWFMTPINIIEEIAKPISLALRLFGNIFAGGVMVLVLSYLLPASGIFGLSIAGWKLFDMAIGVIQAFIFALLTILYFGFEVGGH